MPATELSKRLTKIREERGYKRTELAETDALRKAVNRAKRKSRNHDKITTNKSV